jgi:Fungal protein kinase
MLAPSIPLPTSSESSRPAYYTSSEITRRRPLNSKWLEGSGNTVKETVVELKRLLNMELHDSIKLSQNLAEAIFPDQNLPFPIDNSLLNEPQSTHSQTQTRPSLISLLTKLPEDWLETKTCQWLNDIGDALRLIHPVNKYTNLDGVVVTPSKRVWTSAYSSIYMKQDETNKDSVLHHKPDIILVDLDFNGEVTWPQVHALAEVTCTELIKNRTIKDTVYQKSYVMFRSQDNRCFVPSLYFTGDGFFTFNACDQSGIVYTTTRKILDHPLILLCIIVGLIFGHPSVIMYDETIQCDARGRALFIRVDGTDYRVIAELFKSTALRGWATRCWSVESIGEQKGFVIKDCWADARREQSEIEILELMQELDLCESCCVPRLIHGGNVPVLLNVKSGTYGADCTV